MERLRRSGTAGAQLAQRAAGGNGIARGAIELVTDRLDLGLSASPALSVAYAASGRTPAVAVGSGADSRGPSRVRRSPG